MFWTWIFTSTICFSLQGIAFDLKDLEKLMAVDHWSSIHLKNPFRKIEIPSDNFQTLERLTLPPLEKYLKGTDIWLGQHWGMDILYVYIVGMIYTLYIIIV